MNDADLPYHLRDNAPPIGECADCHRQTWSADELDRSCEMPQPDGRRCPGVIRPRVAP